MTRHLAFRGFAALLLVTLFVPAPAWAQRSAANSAATGEQIFEAIGAHEGMTVCEIGAGDGELSLDAARVVGPHGRVYTSELGDARVRTLQKRVAASGLGHITVVAGDPNKTNFPDAACDAMFMRNVYHHFADPAAMNASISKSLKPEGRLAVVDFTPPDKEAARPAERGNDGMHGVNPESVARELRETGFELVSSEAGDPRWFIVVVRKPKPWPWARCARTWRATDFSGTQLPDRPDLDAAFARRRDLRGRLYRVVQVSRFDEIEARELLLRFRERSVGDRDPSVPHPHRRGSPDGLEGLGSHQEATSPESVTARGALPVGDGVQLLLLEIDKTQVFHTSPFSLVESLHVT